MENTNPYERNLGYCKKHGIQKEVDQDLSDDDAYCYLPCPECVYEDESLMRKIKGEHHGE